MAEKLSFAQCRQLLADPTAPLPPLDRACMNRFSIVQQPAEDPDMEAVARLLRTAEGAADALPTEDGKMSRAVAALLGLVLGDSLGAPLEFSSYYAREPDTVTDLSQALFDDLVKKKFARFQLKAGQWTDDSSMALCLADSLLQHYPDFSPRDLRLRFLLWWQAGLNNAFGYDANPTRGSVGLGGNISMSLAEFERNHSEYTLAGDLDTSGNGSIMRLAPVPIRFAREADVAAALQLAFQQSKTTHQGAEAAECCRLMTYMIIRAANHPSADANEVRASVLTDIVGEGRFETPVYSVQCLARAVPEEAHASNAKFKLEERAWTWREADFEYCQARAEEQPGYIGSYCMDGLAMALHCVWTTTSFRQALVKAANMRGDADTVTAITGQLAGAIYGVAGVPARWLDALWNWDPHRTIPLRALKLYLGHRVD